MQPADAPVGQLVKSLARDTGDLVRQEMQLAAAEMSAKGRVVSKNAAVIATGGALVHLGLLGVLAAVVIALGPVVAWWVSSLVLGAVVLLVGAGLVRKGTKALGRLSPAPEHTAATLRDDVRLSKELVQ
jgi:Putative Actinobacterial Holin-X, holin superfamily III